MWPRLSRQFLFARAAVVLMTPNRKRAWIRGCSTYRAVVQYANGLFASRRMRQLQSRMRAHRAGGGSEAGGEDLRRLAGSIGVYGALVFGTWFITVSVYNVCVNMLS